MVCCISYQRQLLYKMLSFCVLFINEDKNYSEAMALARYILSGLDKVLKYLIKLDPITRQVVYDIFQICIHRFAKDLFSHEIRFGRFVSISFQFVCKSFS
jgi:hypothetical protein